MTDYKGEASQKVKLIDQVKPVYNAIPDSRLKSLYAQELSHRMSVGIDWIYSALTKASSNKDYVSNNIKILLSNLSD